MRSGGRGGIQIWQMMTPQCLVRAQVRLDTTSRPNMELVLAVVTDAPDIDLEHAWTKHE